MESFERLKSEFTALNCAVIFLSADSPKTNQELRKKLAITHPLLSDEDHQVADQFGIPIQRKDPLSKRYRDGFIQPAIFAYRGEEEIYRFVSRPGILNIWGSYGRPSTEHVLQAIRRKLVHQGA